MRKGELAAEVPPGYDSMSRAGADQAGHDRGQAGTYGTIGPNRATEITGTRGGWALPFQNREASLWNHLQTNQTWERSLVCCSS